MENQKYFREKLGNLTPTYILSQGFVFGILGLLKTDMKKAAQQLPLTSPIQNRIGSGDRI